MKSVIGSFFGSFFNTKTHAKKKLKRVNSTNSLKKSITESANRQSQIHERNINEDLLIGKNKSLL